MLTSQGVYSQVSDKTKVDGYSLVGEKNVVESDFFHAGGNPNALPESSRLLSPFEALQQVKVRDLDEMDTIDML